MQLIQFQEVVTNNMSLYMCDKGNIKIIIFSIGFNTLVAQWRHVAKYHICITMKCYIMMKSMLSTFVSHFYCTIIGTLTLTEIGVYR